MSTSPNPAFSQVDGGADAGQPQGGGGFFSQLGSGLKKVMPYLTPIMNRLAAAAGNYGPIELEHQQRQQQMEQDRLGLQQQLQQSQMQTSELNRQLLSKQVENYQTPEQAEALRVKQEGDIAAARAANAPGTVTSIPGQGQFRVKGNTATPIMVPGTPGVPNPTQAQGAGMPPQTMPPLIPPSPTVGGQPSHQLPASSLQGIHYGTPVKEADGSWSQPVYQNGQFVHNEPMNGTPAGGLDTTKSGFTTVYKDDGQGHLIPEQMPSSSTTVKGNGQGPPTLPPVPGSTPPAPKSSPQNPRAALGGGGATKPPTLTSPHAQDWVSWTDQEGRTVAGPLSMASQSGAQNPVKVPGSEVKDINNARQAVNLMTKTGDPGKPETQGVLQLIDSLDKDGKLGILASRWNSLMTTGVGTSPGDDPRIITLINKNMLGDTATMLAHFGASGGRSPQMLQHFLDLANARKMDGETLKSGILSMADYMKDRAMLPGSVQKPQFGAPQQVQSFSNWRQSQQPH